MPVIVSLAQWTQPNLRQVAAKKSKIQMVTIIYSHYAEMARWALLLGMVPFDEVPCLPGEHILPALAMRFGNGPPALSTSSAMTSEKDEESRRKAHATATPCAALPDGTIAKDSWEIAALSGLEPVDAETKRILDAEVGVDSRHLVYYHMLQPAVVPSFLKLGNKATSWFWRTAWSLGLGRHIVQMLGTAFKVDDAEAAEAVRARLRGSFEKLERVLASKKGRFIGGDKPGIADVAMAALAGPIVFPSENYGGHFETEFNEVLQMSKELQEDVDFFRATPVGQHTLMVYKECREKVPI